MIKIKRTLANVFPHLIKEWDYVKNGNLTPEDVFPKGRDLVWWICNKGHSYKTKLANKANGKSCPECLLYSNSITNNKALALNLWDYTKNTISPDRVSYGSNETYWWKCEHEHSFDSPVKAMTRKGGGCPYCRGLRVDNSNSLATHSPQLVTEWLRCVDDVKLTPHTITPGSNKKVKWKCNKNHQWITTPKHRTSGKTNCPKCNQGKKISKPAFTLFYYLKQVFDDTTLEYSVRNSRLILDVYIPSLNIGLEYDGSQYHKKVNRDKNKDKELLEKMPKLKLIRVREPGCGIYHSLNKNVVKYHLPDHKLGSLQDCLINIFIDVFNIKNSVDLQMDNIDILNQMEILEIENSLGKLFPHLIDQWDSKKTKDLHLFNSEAQVMKKFIGSVIKIILG